jgi:hypothetical protein
MAWRDPAFGVRGAMAGRGRGSDVGADPRADLDGRLGCGAPPIGGSGSDARLCRVGLPCIEDRYDLFTGTEVTIVAGEPSDGDAVAVGVRNIGRERHRRTEAARAGIEDRDG